MYEKLKFKPAALRARVAKMRANLLKNRGTEDFLGFGLSVVSRRLTQDRKRYLDYGPYWWALKDLMCQSGYSLGDMRDPVIASHYRGTTAEETMIAADAYREIYLATYFLGTCDFHLSEGEPAYVLSDPDMEFGTN